MASDYSVYDNAFGSVLQNEGDIKKFLDSFFSFLCRRTDFYVVMKTPNDKMGFPPGVAEKLTLSAFKKYAAVAAEAASKQQKSLKQTPTTKRDSIAEVPKVAHVEEVTTVPANNDIRHLSSGDSTPAAEPSMPSPVVAGSSIKDFTEREPDIDTDKHISVAVDANKDPDENDPELVRQQRQFQDNPDSYNGAVRDNYSWSQSITDVDIRVKIPNTVRRSADVSVNIAKKRVKVSYKLSDGKLIDIVDGELTWEIKKDDSMWSLVPGEHVLVNVEKVQERWWDAVFTDEPKISVRKIDPSRPITDLDDEAQAKIEELMYNEQQKRLGRPQSHEQKVHEMLRQAWDVEGSPFQGQPFDPSKLNISQGPS